MPNYLLERQKRDMVKNTYPLYNEDRPNDGTHIPDPDFSRYKKPDKTKDETKKEQQELYEKGSKLAKDLRDHEGALKEWGKKNAEYWKNFPDGTASGAKNFAGARPSLGKIAGGVFFDIITDPLPGSSGDLPPIGPPGAPNEPPEPPDIPAGGDQQSICGKGELNPAFYNGGNGGGFVAQISVKRWSQFRQNPRKEKNMGICKYYCNENVNAGSFVNNFRENLDFAGVWVNWFKYRQRSGVDDLGYWVYTLESQIRKYTINYVGKKWAYKWLIWSVQRFGNGDFSRDPSGYTTHYGHVGKIDCIVYVPKLEPLPVVIPDPSKIEDDMPCKWQTNEISYSLPELAIGDNKIGGSSIQIDDGLIPLADFVVKSIKMMHQGMGLDKLDTELPVSVMKRTGAKIKPKSLAELSQWQFDNVSSLVGLPVANTITSLDNKTKDLTFKNIQDCLSYLVHHQRESDNDLKVLEGYATRTAQQLEAVTQICLRQHADIEMLVKELGFRWKWKTVERKSLYKLGIKDDDKEGGIIELFKGGKVTYPIRVWDDRLDARQISMTTNLYAELASKSNYHSYNSGQGIPGLDARTKMNQSDEEDWKEFVKTVNEPALGVLKGSTTPCIEEYNPASVQAKKVNEPASGLSLFMKPKKISKIR